MKKLVLLLVTTMVAFTAQSQLLSNGGFESNLTNWTTGTPNGSIASFSVNTDANYVHSGSKSLKVTVFNTGSQTNSVLLRHNSISTTYLKTYLIRFWALAEDRNAILHINARGSTTNKECDFKIYDRLDPNGDGWQQYQYLFVADETTTTLDITFNSSSTYYLDDIEIISDDDNLLDVSMQYAWQSNLSGWGWVSGDNDVSVMLPDGRAAWIFNDSFYGVPSSTENYLGGSTILNNMIVVEGPNPYTGTGLYSVFAGTTSSPEPLFVPSSGGLYWIADAFVESNKLKVLLTKWSGLDFADETALATLSLPDLTVEGIQVLPYTDSDIPNAILTDNNYHYIYIAERPESPFERYTKVARVPEGQLNASTDWEFYTTNDTWSYDLSQAKTLISDTEGASVIKLGEGSYAMCGVPNLSNDLAVWFAQSPTGPWTNKTVIYNIPREEGILAYLAHIHKWTENNGVYTLSYSVYPFGGGILQQVADRGSYIPYYVKADLVGLSPYGAGSTNVAPSVEITSPSNNSSFQSPTNIAITASASDSDGSITEVSFYNGTTFIGSDNSSPYTFTQNNVPVGSHTITARATDNKGRVTISSPVHIEVTSNITDITDLGGTVSAEYNDSPPNEDVSKLIDNNASTKYLTFHSGAWVQFHANNSYVVTSYSITSANDHPERDPLHFYLQGSNDGSNWATIDYHFDEDFPNRYQTKTYPFINLNAYSYYRLYMSNNSGSILQIAELELFGTLAGMASTARQMPGNPNAEINDEMPILVYPNPFNDYLYIEFSVDKEEAVHLELLNFSDQLVASKTYTLSKGKHQLNIDEVIHGKPYGIYILRIHKNKMYEEFKVIKK